MLRKIPVEYQTLAGITIGLFALGTTVYHFVEGYTVLDSLYMSVITLATVGYGDFVPHTTLGKLFTIVYVLVGVGVLVSLGATIGKRIIDHRIEVRLKKSGVAESAHT